VGVELLSPAGNLEKLRLAFAYGADAAYLKGIAKKDGKIKTNPH